MVHPIPNCVKKAWNEWNVRGVILYSLSLQTFLIISAPFRKLTAHKLVIFLIWSSYLIADWAASYAVEQISKKQSDDKDEDADVYQDNDYLLAFWAPFLLVHLGGPDPITAFSLEDNELWLRHFIGLLAQVIATVYVFIQTVPGNRLWIPTVLMFLAGIIKYTERTRSLFLASLNTWRNSKLMAEDSSKKEAELSIDDREGKLTELEVVQYAYQFFNSFKGLIEETIISSRKRNESRQFFLQRNATDAYKIIGAELNFIYEALFTKVIVVHTLVGYVFRALSFCCFVAALGLFFTVKKHGFREFDVLVSYTLLFGAIFLDGVALFMIVLSDWTVAKLQKHKGLNRVFKPVFTRYLRLKNPHWSRKGFFEYVRVGLFRRWSESVPGYNLITYCLRENYGPIREYQPDGTLYAKAINSVHFIYDHVCKYFNLILDHIIDYVGARNLVDEWKYANKTQKLSLELWEFIFSELRQKATKAEDEEKSKRMCSAQGAYVLQENEWGETNKDKIEDLIRYIENKAYNESLFLWHIATELCYNDSENHVPAKNEDENNVPEEYNAKDYKEFSKILSDYIMYLMVLQPTLMSAVAGIVHIRFQDTTAEAKNFFSWKLPGRKEKKLACEKILEVNTDVEPVTVKGDRSKSVLFDASILAKKLREFDPNTMWKIISVVWVEKLSFAASHCAPEAHAQQVSKGGELITFVWLLTAHFGLGKHVSD